MRTQDSGLQNEGRGLLAGAWWKMSGKGKPDWESLTSIIILCQLALPFPALTHSATCWLSVELPHCRKLEGKTFHSVKATLGFPLQKLFCTLLYLPIPFPLGCIRSMLFTSRWKYLTLGACVLQTTLIVFFSTLPKLEAPVFWLFQAFLVSRSAPFKNRVGTFGNQYPCNST